MGNRMSSSLIDRTTLSTPVDTMKPVLKKGGFCCIGRKKLRFSGIFGCWDGFFARWLFPASDVFLPWIIAFKRVAEDLKLGGTNVQ